jgi:hypothetical protein
MKTSMSRAMCLCVAVLGLLAGTPALAETLFVAHYQIDVRDGSAIGTVKSQFRLSAGQVESTEVARKELQLSVQQISDKEYQLHVVLAPMKGQTGSRFDQTFRGQFGVPLELDAVAGAVQVSGAISVAVPKF